jgi:hypothetical protein
MRSDEAGRPRYENPSKDESRLVTRNSADQRFRSPHATSTGFQPRGYGLDEPLGVVDRRVSFFCGHHHRGVVSLVSPIEERPEEAAGRLLEPPTSDQDTTEGRDDPGVLGASFAERQ